MRIADPRGPFEPVPVCGDNLSFANIKHHRIEPLISSAPILVVDHHAHRPAVLAAGAPPFPPGRAPWSGLELHHCDTRLHKPVAKVVADELFGTFRARAGIERR